METARKSRLFIDRKVLIGVAIVVVVLFAIALPLGDAHHGLGRHSKAVADLGQTIFVLFEIGFVLLVVLAIVSLIQHLVLRFKAG